VAAVNRCALQPGDVVLFRRGGVWRESLIPPASGSPDEPITFAAYGVGPLPCLTGADAYALREQWTNEQPHIWATADGSFLEDIGHIQVDGEAMCVRVATPGMLKAPRQFCHDAARKRLLVYSEAHPSTGCTKLEVACRPFCIKIHHRHDLVFRELELTHAAVYGLSGYDTDRVSVLRCRVAWIGGKPWPRKPTVGYGNGVEFGGNARACRVAECDFTQIYDSAITHQNWEKDPSIEQQGIEFCDNRIDKCAVGIEVFSHSGRCAGCLYRRNVIRDCGRGWSGNGGLWATGFRIVSTAIDFRDLRVEYNLVADSLHCGMYLSGGEINLRGNTILDSEYGLYITGQDGNRPFTGTVLGNCLARNRACGVYLVDATGHCRFLHNTVASNGDLLQWNHHNVMLDGAANTTWRNNILYATRSLPIAINNGTHTLDYNCYYRPTGPVIGWDNTHRQFTSDRFAEYQALSGQDAHSLVGDPCFVALDQLDLRLLPDSPCRGTAIPDAPADMGAE
jgi:hypothetical protein